MTCSLYLRVGLFALLYNVCAQIASHVRDSSSRKIFVIRKEAMMFLLFALILSINSSVVDAKDLSSVEKRSHNTGPEWPSHCWDHAPNHIMDPFCALLNNNCSTAPTVENGNHSKGYTTSVGSTVSYFCLDGYYLTGPEVITCEKTDAGPEWSQTPVCKKATCPAIPDIENGYHETINSTEIGTNVQYFCDDGYEILDIDTISCVYNGTGKIPVWTQPLPECIGGCTLPVFTNGIIMLPGMTLTTALPDTTLETTTELPYTTTDEPELYNVTTTTEVPDTFNETTTVTAMPDISNDTTTNLTDNTNETDNTDNSITSTAITTFLPDTTTVPPATATTISPYAYVRNETFHINDTIIYKCNAGYSIVSTANVGYVGNAIEATCVIATNASAPLLTSNKISTWSTTVVCVPECPPVVDVLNANYTAPSNTLEGSTVVYTCFPGFEMVGPTEVKCLSTGNWSELPRCIGCMAAPEIDYGTHDANYTTTINSTVSYVCSDGFSMIGLEVITCNAINEPPYANWSEPPFCTRACGPIPSIENGVHTDPENILIGGNLTYSCLPGFEMDGSSNVVCMPPGNWSQTPVCKLECVIKSIDIVFIIDGSGSLGVHGFDQTLQFVVDMVSKFPIETTRFGLLTFSSDTYLQFHLNGYVNDSVGLIGRIQNTSFPTGGTHTYAGLEFARTDMFQVVNGMRPNVTHTAIVVTDGHSDNINETAEQAQLLKDSGVTIYSVGVGLTDVKELELIASNTTFVFTVDNYDRINEITGPLAGITCASTLGPSDDDDVVQ
ncbi:complement receptor type 1-like [Mercenaria mercenaria]|uniref:complement receptor type 1-like n=1 Tax=Mercenaria mercenaria TaxID=6596 RepID=UPI00234EE777|nr:complement receptor type 1-like [Mercenaria mercenaria]